MPAGLLPAVRVLSALFRRLFLEQLAAAHAAGRLHFFGAHAPLAERHAFAAYLAPLRKIDWVVLRQAPSPDPRRARLSQAATPPRAIANQPHDSPSTTTASPSDEKLSRQGTGAAEGHELAATSSSAASSSTSCPAASTASVHYGLFANGGRAENLARPRDLLGVPARQDQPQPTLDAMRRAGRRTRSMPVLRAAA